jgi:hypothetical protein
MANFKKPVLFLVFLAFICPASTLFAQYSRPKLALNISKSEAQAKWGAPASVVDKELKQESIWTYQATEKYPEQILIFRSNKLALIDGYQALAKTIVNPSEQASVNIVPVSKAFMPVQNQEALTEILKEVPTDQEGAKGDAQTPPQAAARFN